MQHIFYNVARADGNKATSMEAPAYESNDVLIMIFLQCSSPFVPAASSSMLSLQLVSYLAF
jgi:hypothetical protein